MNQLALDHKPLPSPAVPSPPSPPPKHHQDGPHSARPPQLTDLPSFASFDPGLAFSLTPTTPVTPSSSSFPSPDQKPKKPNPLNDLIDTEKTYVDHLTGIIRKVAAAWSRSNLPPPDLDAMFRSIEAVYKANRALHSKLKDIGANPSNPKALGDLLMRWIDDLNAPYTTYCTKYRCGFDTWDPVQSNAKLATILSTFSASNPPPSSAIASNSTNPPVWTLDDLFLLPKARLKYYKKLYGRLLKSTAPGRSDHRLLIGALETLDNLLGTLESRSSVIVGQAVSPNTTAPVVPEAEDQAEDQVVIDLRTQSVIQEQGKKNGLRTSAETAPGSESSSTRGSTVSNGERLSQETATTSVSRVSSGAPAMPISDLERRLSTQRTLDIFTMKPKVVRLQMTPPTLTFTRELRFFVDVVIRFIPQATGVEIVHKLGHIFILSDLFLICERLPHEQRSQEGPEGADMSLCYPPLSGKVLRVFDMPEQPNALKVTIMRKETLILETDSAETRDRVMAQFKECIEFAGSLPPPSKQLPPPVPSLNGFPHSSSAPLDRNASPLQSPLPPPRNTNASPPVHGASSPPYVQRHESAGPPTRPPMYQNVDARSAGSMSRLVLSPEAQMQQGAQRVPSMHDPLPGPMYPRTSSSAQQFPHGPGQPTGPPPLGQQFPNRPSSGQQFSNGPPPGQQFPNGPPPGQQFPNRPPSGQQFPNGPPPGQQFPNRPPSGQQFANGPPGQQFPNGPTPRQQFPNGPHGQQGAGRSISFGAQGPRPGPGPGHNPNAGQYGPPPPFQQNNPFPPRPPPGAHGLPPGAHPPRPPSEPGFGVRKSPSTRSLASQYSYYEQNQAPPLPAFPGGHPPNGHSFLPRSSSYSNLSLSLQAPQPRPLLPSLQNASRSVSMAEPSFDEPSPPNSPVEETPKQLGPVTSSVSAQMKCKVFLQQQHAQWKSLGSAKLKLYHQDPTNIKQLVVETDNKDRAVLISTIVLTDGVERVGKTGVAIELSDKGARTGLIYMIQLRNEKSAGGLFDSLLAGSDRAARG